MRKWSLTALGVVFVIAVVYFRALASVEELGALEIERLPVVSGRVVHGGSGVEHALVRLEPLDGDSVSRGATLAGGASSAPTDAEGRFELSVAASGRHAPVAIHSRYGSGRGAPLELDGARSFDGIEIALDDAPGALRATLILPAGRAPSDVTLVAEGSPRDFQAGLDGSFWMPDLVPGPCLLSVLGSEPDSGAPAWLPQEFCFEVEVVAEETREIELDLTQVPPCRVQGAVAIGTRFHGVPSLLDEGRPAPAPRVWLGRGTPWKPYGAVRLDPEGRFLLGVSTPGRYELRLELGFPELELKWVVRDELELSTTPREWTLSVASGALRLLPPDPQHPIRSEPELDWHGEGERTIQVLYPLIEKADGSVLYTHLPAGTVTFSIGRTGQQHPYSCEIRAGETTELRLAQ